MTNDHRHFLEQRIIALGRAEREIAYAYGDERQEAFARATAADRWEDVQDALDALDEGEEPCGAHLVQGGTCGLREGHGGGCYETRSGA